MAIFPVIDEAQKDQTGYLATQGDNLVCRAIAEVKSAVPDIGVIADVALDPFTSHGHDGILDNGEILNDATLEVLCEQALVQARAGVDIIAPSDMMDGRVGAIREALDAQGYNYVAIMAYTAKYASAFYGPFRQALNSGNLLQGDKKTYQMDPANGLQALREACLDIQEGADMVMVKPGLPYLDIITNFKREFDVPVMAYNVSGEYAMLRTACDQGMLDFKRAVPEMLLSFKRAGADSILTYFALDAARLLKQ
jgi:porphobilinogen synthase